MSSNSELNPPNDNGSSAPKNKRKYNFQRASVACDQCRKAKTRCNYIENGSNCFRCENLSLKCSLSEHSSVPVLSTFQKSANIATRDEVLEQKSQIQQKKKKRKSLTANNSMLGIQDNTPLSTIDSASTNKSDYNFDPSSNSMSNSISTSISPTDNNLDSNALAIINSKIDKLTSIISILVEKDLNNNINNNNNNNNNTVNSGALIPAQNSFVDFNSVPLSTNRANRKPSTTLDLSFQNPNLSMHPNLNPNMNMNMNMNMNFNPSMNPSMNPNINPNINPSMNSNMNPNIPSNMNNNMNNNMNTTINPNMNMSMQMHMHMNKFYPPNTISKLPLAISNEMKPPFVLQPSINAPLARPYLQTSNKLSNLNTLSNNSNIVSTVSKNPNNIHENDEFFFLNAPYVDIINTSTQLGLPFSKEIGFDITKDMVLISIQERYDLINRKLLDYDTCYSLIEIAVLHCGKWISFYQEDFKTWFDSIRISSPLLFCTLVLFGLRYQRLSNMNENLELDILQSIHQLLSLSIYEVPQNKEFLQTCILLTHYSPSLSYRHIYFDSWWISSYGLIHFMTREMSINLLVKSVKSNEKIHQYRIWNHLTISHLINCILSGRPCIVDEIRLDQCRDILDLPEANSFDAIIVAQLCMILSLYNSLLFPENVENSIKELDGVYSDWKYLTNEISSGFTVKVFYYFAKLMILRRYMLKNLFLKGQIEFKNKCNDFLKYMKDFYELIKSRDDLFDGSDLVNQCIILSIFMLLHFKQLGLFDDDKVKNDKLIIKCVDTFLDLCSSMDSKIHCFNNYFINYYELIRRFKNSLFNNNNNNDNNVNAKNNKTQ